MPGNTATLSIEVAVDADGGIRVLKDLGRQTEAAGGKSDDAFKRAGRSVGTYNAALSTAYKRTLQLAAAYVSVTAITRLAGAFVSAASEAENYRIRLNAVLGSTAEGARLFQEMADYASKVPFQYKEIMGAATSLAGVMAGGVDEVKRWMPLIGDLAAVSGLSIQQTTEQVVRMYSAGAASADLFRERGVLAMLGFQAGVSYSAEETRDRLIDAWEDVDSKFRGTTAKLADTWDGLMSMFGDAWFQFRTLVMDSGPFDAVKGVMRDMLDYFDRIKRDGRLDEWARDMATGVLTAFAAMLEAVDLFSTALTNLRVSWNLLAADYRKQMADAALKDMAGLLDRLQQVKRERLDYLGGATGERQFYITKEGQSVDVGLRKYDIELAGIRKQMELLGELHDVWTEQWKESTGNIQGAGDQIDRIKGLIADIQGMIDNNRSGRGAGSGAGSAGTGGGSAGTDTAGAAGADVSGYVDHVERIRQELAETAEFERQQSAAAVAAWKQNYDERIKLVQDFAAEYDKIGKSAHQLEQDRIREQAQRYIDAGADRVKVEEWLLNELKKLQDDFWEESADGMYVVADDFEGMLDGMLGALSSTVADMSKEWATGFATDLFGSSALGKLGGSIFGSVVGTGINALIGGLFGDDEPAYDPAQRAAMLASLNDTIAGEAVTLEQELAALSREYQSQYMEAAELQIAVGKVTEAYMAEAERIREEYSERARDLEQELMLVVSPELAEDLTWQIAQINREYETQAEQARNLGVSLDLVAAAREAEIELTRQQRTEAQRAWADALQGTIASGTSGAAGLLAQATASQTALARAGWTADDFAALRDDLLDQLDDLDDTSADYYDRSLELLSELYGVQQEIRVLEEESLAQQTITAGALAGTTAQLYDTIRSITGGDLAAVQSAKYFEAEFNRLVAGVYGAEDMAAMSQYAGALNEFIPSFLEFMTVYKGDQAGVNAQAVSELRDLGAYLVEAGLTQYGTAFADAFEAQDWDAILQNDDLRQLYEQIAANTASTVGALTGSGTSDPYLSTIIARLNDQIALMGAQLTGQALMDLGTASSAGGIQGLSATNLLTQAASLSGAGSAYDLVKQMTGGDLAAGGTASLGMLGGTLYLAASPVDAGSLAAQFVYGEGGVNPLTGWQAQQQALWDAERTAAQEWLAARADEIEARWAKYKQLYNLGNDPNQSYDDQLWYGTQANRIRAEILAGKETYLDQIERLLEHGGTISDAVVPWWKGQSIYQGIPGIEGILRYGGLATGPSIVGEAGDEWAVPTYEPERGRFLRDVGADPDLIGQAVARTIAPLVAGRKGEMHMHLYLDGREIATGCAVQLEDGHYELRRAVKRAVT